MPPASNVTPIALRRNPPPAQHGRPSDCFCRSRASRRMLWPGARNPSPRGAAPTRAQTGSARGACDEPGNQMAGRLRHPGRHPQLFPGCGKALRHPAGIQPTYPQPGRHARPDPGRPFLHPGRADRVRQVVPGDRAQPGRTAWRSGAPPAQPRRPAGRDAVDCRRPLADPGFLSGMDRPPAPRRSATDHPPGGDQRRRSGAFTA